jgi:electron transport complex protein RnfC
MRQLYRFHGGLRLEGHKDESLQRPLRTLPAPAQLCLPLTQHIGSAAEPLVRVGDRVRRGQRIAQAKDDIAAHVHAPTAGIVREIAAYPVPHPSGLAAPCVLLDCVPAIAAADASGQENGTEAVDFLPPWADDWRSREPGQLRERIRDAGIVGLGGAAFPTAVKLQPRGGIPLHTLIVNGAECEPYITCDDVLMQTSPMDILDGIQIVAYLLGIRQVLFAIEDNKPLAYQSLVSAVAQRRDFRCVFPEMAAPDRTVPESGSAVFEAAGTAAAVPGAAVPGTVVPAAAHVGLPLELLRIPSIYPTGGERQLIRVLTGEEVPSAGLPGDLGLVCQNPGTLKAIADAVLRGQPLLSRLVTVTGSGVREPCNIEALLGTPFAALVAAAGGYAPTAARLLMGGPMMGFAIAEDAVPVIKGTNCILVLGADDLPKTQPVQPCIRCGHCVDACPAQLLPQQLYWFARSRQWDAIQAHDLFDCIECGCCAQVCPSHLPLVQYYRFAKQEIWNLDHERVRADQARERFEFRQARQAREEQEKAAKMAQKKASLTTGVTGETPHKPAIEAALERARARKAGRSADDTGPATPP